MGIYRRDRRSRYQQIADNLKCQITEGRYSPGDQLPSLATLCQSFQVSKTTASSALAVLDQQKLIAVRHGLRSVVLPPPTSQDEDGVAGMCQQVKVMVRRQGQIVEQVHSLDQTLARIQRQVHQLRLQATPLRQPSESPPD